MPSRAIGAFLALAAAAAIVVSIAASAWWAGAPVVEGKQIEAKYVHAGPLGATGCNVGGDGSCTPITVDDTVKLVGYAALGSAALATLFLFILMSAALRVSERRKGIATSSLLLTLLAAGGAGALLALGPGIKASQHVDVPIGWGTFAFGGGIVAALLASLITRRLEPEPLRLKPGVTPAPIARPSRPKQAPLVRPTPQPNADARATQRESQQDMRRPAAHDPRSAPPGPQLRPLYELQNHGYAPAPHAPQVASRPPTPPVPDALGALLDSMGPSTPALSPQLGGSSNAFDDESDLAVPGGLVDEAVNPFARTKAPSEVPPQSSSPRIRPPQDNAPSSPRKSPTVHPPNGPSASAPARPSAPNIGDLIAPASLVGATRDPAPAGIAGDPLRSKPLTAPPSAKPPGVAPGDLLRSKPPTASPEPKLPGIGPNDSGRMKPPPVPPEPKLPGMGPNDSGRMKPPTAPPSTKLPGMGPSDSGRMKPPTAPPSTKLPGIAPSDPMRAKPPTAPPSGAKLPGLPPSDAARAKPPTAPPGAATGAKLPGLPPSDAARAKPPTAPPGSASSAKPTGVPPNAARTKAASIPPSDPARSKPPSIPPVRPVVPAPAPRAAAPGKSIVVPEHLRASTDIGTPAPAQPAARQSRPGIPNEVVPPTQSRTIAHAVPPMPAIDGGAHSADDDGGEGTPAGDVNTAVEIDHAAKAIAQAAKDAQAAKEAQARAAKAAQAARPAKVTKDANGAPAATAARPAARDDDDDDAPDVDGTDEHDADDDTDDVDASVAPGGPRRAGTDMRTGKNPLAAPAVGEKTAVGLLAAPPAPALRFGAGRADSQDDDEGTVQTPIPTREPDAAGAASPIDLMKTIEMNGKTPIPTLGRTGQTAAEVAAQRYAFDTDKRAEAADKRAEAADKRPVQVPISTAPSTLPPPKQLDPVPSGPTPACPQCESPMSWVDEHLRFYCRSCRMYF